MADSMHLRRWTFGKRDWQLGEFPRLMGILNVTPDSFSDGGVHNTLNAAVDHAMQLVEDGADIIDIGGESTRPGAEPVTSADELNRTIPVIQRLAERSDFQTPISIDTTKATVAREALAAGAEIVNDISGLQFDAAMPSVCAEFGAGVICMHIQGTPQTMQAEPAYDNVVQDICSYFEQRISVLTRDEIQRSQILLDPGIGFGKTADHNIQILQNIAAFRALGHGVLIGHSRKRFLSKVVGRAVDERLAGTVGVSIALAQQSTDLIRVHDVRNVRDALVAWQATSAGC